ncbi:hypothetical protein Mp_7g07420 [Marchantia polymorpha subsp. ruderalis]|uniref:Uncharacterized protein n=2 Tax=Marchantia polymorpha TaxID=3197 RepID=A0AAF6BX32_MARPO|nr:hypothetical protein MARPO_0076s0052 [Marchantia polymorpha]BBN16566.1 hypothetical protein Mp_7g07420 [Marchantia polymorpha subsp. ruderalis]|eukprot:PTQ34812.1 hypothetical protein MARPO_0076s0052 [Marchantia polymorpha]
MLEEHSEIRERHPPARGPFKEGKISLWDCDPISELFCGASFRLTVRLYPWFEPSSRILNPGGCGRFFNRAFAQHGLHLNQRSRTSWRFTDKSQGFGVFHVGANIPVENALVWERNCAEISQRKCAAFGPEIYKLTCCQTRISSFACHSLSTKGRKHNFGIGRPALYFLYPSRCRTASSRSQWV